MHSSNNGIMVIKMPGTVDTRSSKTFLREFAESIAQVVRPCVVLDCSSVRRVDGAFLNLLLCSLEEAMKRNGDVRLCCLSEAARPAMQSMSMENLFRFYPTAAEAAESFRRPAGFVVASTSTHESTAQPSARAA